MTIQINSGLISFLDDYENKAKIEQLRLNINLQQERQERFLFHQDKEKKYHHFIDGGCFRLLYSLGQIENIYRTYFSTKESFAQWQERIVQPGAAEKMWDTIFLNWINSK